MDNQNVYRDTQRKREKRKNENFYERETRLARDREKKREKRAAETTEEQERHLASDRNRKRHKEMHETNELNIINEQLNQNTDQQDELSKTESSVTTRVEPLSATVLCNIDRDMLRNFRNKMDKLKHTLCPTCNKRFPSIVLVMRECRRCYSEKTLPKRFSADNNMDPGEVPEELQNLTDIEEMLIAQVFPVMSVYKLRGGQYGYRGNVINFPQNVQEFITRLPRHPSSLDVLVIFRQSANSGSFRDFIVRRDKVASALYWLKANNIYYAKITIDNEILESLPTDGTIEDQIPDNEIIAEDRIQNEHRPIAWPHINDNPINEFRTPGYIACAFPMLYPTGCADLRSERIRDISPAAYFKHLLQYKDGRFARHNRWRYFALNSLMQWRALQEGKIYIKQQLGDEQLTVQEIQEMIAQGDKHIADRIMRYGEGLRESRQFWMARRRELSDMIKQIGSRGLVFFTFSAADLHWPELHDLMPSNENSTEETEMTRHYHQNVINNPHIVAWFFNKCFETFLNDVLKHRWNLEDYWYRFEWQHRGSVHVHGIGKIRNAPEIEWMRMKEDENVMGEVVMYLDSLVTTINPGLNAPIPNCYPCKKRLRELRDDLQDYTELVNKLQRHMRCSPSYCLRVNKAGQQLCRFGYPKENSDHTIVHDDGNGQPELITVRNDQYINMHSRLQLQGWRANIDLKPILSLHAALQYISKYASKAEPQSATFSEILNQILRNSNPDDQVISS
ncbi:1521_t:CDS:2, partial [Cetraspora pellucida]